VQLRESPDATDADEGRDMPAKINNIHKNLAT